MNLKKEIEKLNLRIQVLQRGLAEACNLLDDVVGSGCSRGSHCHVNADAITRLRKQITWDPDQDV